MEEPKGGTLRWEKPPIIPQPGWELRLSRLNVPTVRPATIPLEIPRLNPKKLLLVLGDSRPYPVQLKQKKAQVLFLDDLLVSTKFLRQEAVKGSLGRFRAFGS